MRKDSFQKLLTKVSFAGLGLILSGCGSFHQTNQAQPYQGIASGAELSKITPSSQTYQLPPKPGSKTPSSSVPANQSSQPPMPTNLKAPKSMTNPDRPTHKISSGEANSSSSPSGAAVTLGTQTVCGMVVNVRGPLAKIQMGNTSHWVLTQKLLAAKNISQCP